MTPPSADGVPRRVVVTGVGLVSPLACGAEASWRRLIRGESGLGPIEGFDASAMRSRVAGHVPTVAPVDGDLSEAFDAEAWLSPKEARRVDRFVSFGAAAAMMALDDGGWHPESDESRFRSGVIMGSGTGGLSSIETAALTLRDHGPKRVSPFFIPGTLINMIAGYVSIARGLKGPCAAAVSACASAADSIAMAFDSIRLGDADVMVAGGAEAGITPVGVAGFQACRALSTGFNDEPTKASRPYDRRRDGFVIAEGGGALLLESLDHARSRGATPLAELSSYGRSSDAFHATAPDPQGDGGRRAMASALDSAGLVMDDIDYVNAHGTSTPLGDEIELSAVASLHSRKGDGLTMSSTKSAIGHLLGAAGGAEAVFSVLAIRDGIAPPTLNLEDPSVETAIDLAPHRSKAMRIDSALSNSFGFGGTNCSLVFRRLVD